MPIFGENSIFDKAKERRKRRKLNNEISDLDTAFENDYDQDYVYEEPTYADFITGDDATQKDLLQDEGFLGLLADNEKAQLAKDYKGLIADTYRDQGIDKFKEAIGSDYYDTLDTELKNQLEQQFQGIGDTYKGVERGASFLAGALEPALRLASGAVKNDILDKALDYNYDYKAPVFRGGVAPIRAVQALPPEIIAAMKQSTAHTPIKTSDVTANIIGDNMSLTNKLQGANQLAQMMADWRGKELTRFDQGRMSNAKEAGLARDKTASAAAEVYNKKLDEERRRAELRAANEASRVTRKKEKIKGWADRVAKAGEMAYESSFKRDAMAKENLLEQIDLTRDLIDETTNSTLRDQYEEDLADLVRDHRAGNFDLYKSNTPMPRSIWDLNAGVFGVNNLRTKRSNGGKLIPRRT